MRISYKEAADFLRNNDNFYIFTHANPDGDTVGSGFGLCSVLRRMGKRANVYCSDVFPRRYDYIYGSYEEQEFVPDKIIAVDIADTKLMGRKYESYKDKIDLCIDHHISNTDYAAMTLVEPEAAAACQVVYKLCAGENLTDIDKKTAECLYTGIATDTGCFKFSCTSAETHVIAAELMKTGIDTAWINRRMFDQKSRARLAVEQFIMNNISYHYDFKCAISAVTTEMIKSMNIPADEFEGLAPLTIQLETVEVGIMMRQKDDGGYKVSMRSSGAANVSAICAEFGGGGHVKAAGCTMTGDLDEVKAALVSAVGRYLGYAV